MTTVVNHLIDDAFGRVTSESNPAVESLFLFTARPFDAATGLQNNLNRWYDPAVGRWLSEDPIGFTAGDGNVYRYVGNSAVIHVDLSGFGRQLTNKILREACENLFGRSGGKAYSICCFIVRTLKGKTCNELFSYCAHIHNHSGDYAANTSKICMALYNAVCFGE